MSGTFPATFFTTLDFKSNNNTRVTTSISGRTQRAAVAGQYFSLKLASTPLEQVDFKRIYAFVSKQRGRLESFTIVPPEISSSSGTAAGVSTVTQSYAAGVDSIRANGATGTLLAGDFIKFSNHNKVYLVTDDVNMDASSEDTIPIFPSLVTAVNATTTIVYDNVPFTVMLVDDASSFTTDANGFYRYAIEVREEL